MIECEAHGISESCPKCVTELMRENFKKVQGELENAKKLLEKVVSDSDIGVVPRSHIDNIEKFLAE